MLWSKSMKFQNASSPAQRAAKPEKILFDNPLVMQALGIINKVGTVRESFAASMLSAIGQLRAAKDGDFILDGTYTFEVGAKGKNSTR